MKNPNSKSNFVMVEINPIRFFHFKSGKNKNKFKCEKTEIRKLLKFTLKYKKIVCHLKKIVINVLDLSNSFVFINFRLLISMY